MWSKLCFGRTDPERDESCEDGEKDHHPEEIAVTSSKKEYEWEKYTKMTLEEKRKLYKCGNDFTVLKYIQTWSNFYQDDSYHFSKLKKSNKIDKPLYPFSPRINDKVSLWTGDITELEIDAIVNAANNSLLGGGGVDGCIHRAAGPTLVKECTLLKHCETGDAKITSGHKLPARYVIHTVGPIGKNNKALKSCYETCLRLSLEHGIKTLAFCCISTGIYGYPNRDAAEVALSTTREWLDKESNADAVDRIIFCLFLEDDIKIYESLMFKYFPPEELKGPVKQSEKTKTAETSLSETKQVKERKDEVKKRKDEDDKNKDNGKTTQTHVECGYENPLKIKTAETSLSETKQVKERKDEVDKKKDDGKTTETGVVSGKESPSTIKELQKARGEKRLDEDRQDEDATMNWQKKRSKKKHDTKSGESNQTFKIKYKQMWKCGKEDTPPQQGQEMAGQKIQQERDKYKVENKEEKMEVEGQQLGQETDEKMEKDKEMVEKGEQGHQLTDKNSKMPQKDVEEKSPKPLETMV